MNEFLNESARKAKRNLWILGSLSLALATGILSPEKEGAKISIGGIGLETSMPFIFGALILVLIFNLINLLLHQNYGTARALADNKARVLRENPINADINRVALDHITKQDQIAGFYGRVLLAFEIKIPFWFGVSSLGVTFLRLLREAV